MANKIYVHEEASVDFLASGGDVSFSPTTLASGEGHQSAHHDLTTSARARVYAWRAWCEFNTSPVVGQTVRVYLKTGDGTNFDNDEVATDHGFTAEDKLRNLHFIGSIVVDEISTTVAMVSSGVVDLSQRYVAVVFWNGTDDALSSTAADQGFSLTPVPDEVQ